MTMGSTSWTARLLAAAALFATVLALSTVVTTCRAAADSDARVDYGFCVAELGKHRESPDADTWGLAKVAALTGVVNANDAVYNIKAMLAKPGGADLGQCQKIYDSMGFSFAEAEDDINNRDYAAGKGKAASMAHQCDDALAKAGAVPSPLAQRSSYSVQIAIICTAITNLIK